VPACATPKDGPSAGITMATAIASMLTGLKVDPNLAMTGEITLTGQVLPIGGLKEKVLGAKRAGISKIVFPKRNEIDLDDIPKEVRDTMMFVPVEEISEVLQNALGKRIVTPVALAENGVAHNVVPMRRRATATSNGAVKRRQVERRRPVRKR
jgi:ATP-dependent Lon protease